MKIYKIIFVVLCTGQFLGTAQTIQEPVHGLRDVSERWRISLFAGLPMMGPGEDIETNMRNSGLGDFRPGDQIWFWPIPAKQFPDRKSGLIWNVKMQYRITNSSAINFVYGTSSKSKVEGYDEIDHIGGIENYLTIKSITKYGAIHYVWNFG
ncbi:MAG TPA: hypothetical protein VJ508_03965, partial [Saprospiraceae bacterium]|nr:hypothetical protein [Saprospiraceae bacterium]